MIRGKCPKGILEPIYPCDETFAVLEEYLKAIPTDRTIKKDGVLTPLILSSSNRNLMGRISRNGIRSIMNKTLNACNLKNPGCTCHIFRHSCGTNLYQETKDLRLVQEVLRHRDPKITARYAHVADRMEKVAEALSLPETLKPFTIVPFGYPAKKNPQPDRFDEQRVHYVK